MKVETLIDKTAAFFLFMSFPLFMTGGAAAGSDDVNQVVEGTALTVGEMATLVASMGFASFVLGFLIIGLLLIVPRRVLRWDIRLPRVNVEW